ncbi:hypothetical protein LZ30DRAFT_84222 [Colletotrichum cereale]|nr:hypothetical protein LZ30DRAFT_84222 [Colletotrichum cereale]
MSERPEQRRDLAPRRISSTLQDPDDMQFAQTYGSPASTEMRCCPRSGHRVVNHHRSPPTRTPSSAGNRNRRIPTPQYLRPRISASSPSLPGSRMPPHHLPRVVRQRRAVKLAMSSGLATSSKIIKFLADQPTPMKTRQTVEIPDGRVSIRILCQCLGFRSARIRRRALYGTVVSPPPSRTSSRSPSNVASFVSS